MKPNTFRLTGAGILLLCLIIPFASATFTINAAGGGTNYLGDDIQFSGTNDESTTVYLFLTGPNLGINGAQIASIDPAHNPVVDGNALTFKAAPVSSNTWSWTWPTSGLALDAGTYTVYAIIAPHDKANLGNYSYGTVSLVLKKPFTSGTTRTRINDDGAIVFIGEQGLDITPVVGNATSLAWWANASDRGTTMPSVILSIPDSHNFYVAPGNFVGYYGEWYAYYPINPLTGIAAFDVEDPTLDLIIKDIYEVDVTDSTVQSGTILTFEFLTNMNSIGSPNRVNVGPDSDGIMNINVTGPDGGQYQSLFNQSDVPTLLTGLLPLPGWVASWNTSSLVNGNYRYPAGTYTVTAESNLNSMRDNYKNAGADYTGKTVSPAHTITLSPFPQDVRDAVDAVAADPSIVGPDISKVALSASPDPVAAGTVINQLADGKPSFTATADGYFVFVDMDPNANWEHPAKYVLVSKADGSRTPFDASMPPRDIAITYAQGKVPNPSGGSVADPSGKCSSLDCTHCYALLISGGMNTQNNNIRYWTDISNMYVTLRNYYCYPADHITVLMSDGLNNGNDRLKAYTAGGTPQYDNSPTDFGLGDPFSDVKGAATKADVVDNLTILNKTLTSQDTLFIFTTNHGGNDTTPGSGNAKLYLWNNESIKDSEFVAPLKYSQAKTIMMGMGQCFAGGFSGDFIDMPGPSTRVFTSAANKDEPSWGSAFNTPWIQGLNGNADSAPTLDGVVSMYEAYNWAKLKDEYATPNNIEHPQFAYSTQVNPDFINLSSCWLTTNCPAVVSLPTGQTPKRKSTSRCLYEDLNGDGHFNIDDATFFFSNFEWIAANEPITAVDFNGNNRIDFGDVVKLYLMSQNPNNVY